MALCLAGNLLIKLSSKFLFFNGLHFLLVGLAHMTALIAQFRTYMKKILERAVRADFLTI